MVVEGDVVLVPVGGRVAVMMVVVVWITEVIDELDATPGRH